MSNFSESSQSLDEVRPKSNTMTDGACLRPRRSCLYVPGDNARALEKAGSLPADVLILDEVRQVERMDLPKNGQTMQAIESRFGAPRERHDAVGEPPITRWDYSEYSVYFEYDRVLFSVLHPGGVIERS